MVADPMRLVPRRAPLTMRFYLLMRQAGEGCDYTIGCGYRWDTIEAPTREAAIELALKAVLDRGWGGDRVESALLMPANQAIDLAPLLDDHMNRERAEAARVNHERQQAAERAEFERLRKIYGS
jgi:hypothetical protein